MAALVSEGSDERNVAVYSPSITEEANSTKTQQLTETLTSPSSLPTLPFDLIYEILSRLPVKPLLQFQCVCKSWNSVISDPKFAKKHLSHSTTHSFHCLSYSNKRKYNNKYILNSYSLDSVLTNVTTIDVYTPWNIRWRGTYIQRPFNRMSVINEDVYFVGSCNGILCFAHQHEDLFLVHLWNPSIRKFKNLPLLQKPQNRFRLPMMTMYGFGFDPVSDNYKVVVVLCVFDDNSRRYKSELMVHTLGTGSWKNISVFCFDGNWSQGQPSGKYVSGTINWLVYMGNNQGEGQFSIGSFDLGNDCYQQVLLPDHFVVDAYTHLSVFRDCLCLIYGQDVWVMKEYGNKESWTKLFTISLTPSYSYIKAKYVFEDDQVLIESKASWPRKYIVYNFRNGTSKLIEVENPLEVCVESLISCF